MARNINNNSLVKKSEITSAASTVGSALFTLPNPGDVRYLKINADNTVSTRTSNEMLSDLEGLSFNEMMRLKTILNY